MIQEISLPFGRRVFFCDVCGFGDSLEGQMTACREAGEPIQSPVVIGDKVLLYWVHHLSRGRVRTDQPEEYTISSLWYQQPLSHGMSLAYSLAGSFAGRDDAVPHTVVHELKIGLKQQFSENGWASADKSLSEFLLLQEGDIEKMLAARLIDRPKPPKSARRWWQFWKR